MLTTDGPVPVKFTSNGKEYTVATTVLCGKHVRLLKAEIASRGIIPKPNDADALDTLNDSDFNAFNLHLNCGISIEEAEEISDRENVFTIKEMLIRASGWRELGNSILAEEDEAQKS